MYDIHCHLIPSIDDGARDMDEAISLLKIAENDGITHIVLTPHIHLGKFNNNIDDIFTNFFSLKQKAADANLRLNLAFAAEVRIDAELITLFQHGKIPFIGNSLDKKVVLLELPHSNYPQGADNLIKWMISNNILPLIAHPERNRDIQKNTDLILKLKRLGCLLQVTAGSIVGDFGEKPKQIASFMLENKLADIVASDAHNLKRRPPILSKAFKEVCDKYTAEYAENLFINTPKLLTKNLFIC
ncbi:tyrosine-protein phosphatase [Pseudoalteromonas sp. SSM20]|uniref:tyrosine-protein phosphatase n=1 Tax=Pseudoalteromonas sp. SSM20 TaxID=3139394 RepID=UPI003BAA1730